MNEEKEKVRCAQCELVQWADHTNCRRCGQVLPAPIVNVMERVVERVVINQDSQCLKNLEEASKLISATAARLEESTAQQKLSVRSSSLPGLESLPTLDEMERAMIMAAYRKSNRKPVEAARMLGIGKTTFYRKLKEIRAGNSVTTLRGQSGLDPLPNRPQPGRGATPADQARGATDLDVSIWSPRDSQPQALQSI